MEAQAKPTILRRGLTLVGTLITIGIAGAVVAVGAGVLNDRAEAVPAPQAAARIPVAVDVMKVEESYTIPRRFIGQVEAGTEATLSFELGGRLAELTADEGDTVKKGQIIARLDTGLLQAELARLKASRAAITAQLAFAESRLERARELQGQGFSSQETLDQALATRDELTARIAEIDAGIASVDINISKSEIRAPFDGRVGAQSVDVTETLSAGQPVLSLIETTEPMVRIGLPLGLSPEALAKVTIDIEGVLYPAELRRIRPDIDPVTRTRTALFALDTDDAPTFGQTATLSIDMQVAARGTWVPVDALQEGSGSIWNVLVVEDGTVRTAAAELLHAETDRAFVRGTFAEGATLIRSGAHRVVPGQQVTVLNTGE